LVLVAQVNFTILIRVSFWPKFWVLHVDTGKENNHVVGVDWKHLLQI
jgi:hypothetical protein